MNRLLSVGVIYDGGKVKIPEVNIHRPCKVIITFLEESSQSEEEDVFDILLKSDPAFGCNS